MKTIYSLETGVTRITNKTAQFVNRVTVGTASLLAIAGLAFIPLASAATNTTTVVTPDSTVYDSKNVVGVNGDAAPGFAYGSIASDGSGKTDAYFSSDSLFGRHVALGEIASMSYWTKKGTDHVVQPGDWYINIYTDSYPGDASTSWYGDRIGSEPYYSKNLSEQVGAWNQWSTDGSQNQLRFFESTAGAPGANFGSYTDPTWSDFVAGNALSGSAYATHTVNQFSIQTASGWADGFTGQVDGLTITLTDGTTAKVNFEPFETVSNKDACKDGGWTTAVDANGNHFRNQGLCVSFVASNGKSQH